MFMKRLLAIVIVLAFAMLCMAQTAQPPKPGPEVQKLAYYVGTWKVESEVNAGYSFPAGKYSGTQACEWFAGGFHVVCRDEGTTPAGKVSELSIYAYDADAKAYVTYGISSLGQANGSKGSLAGSTWTWLSDGKVAGKPAKFRYSDVEVSPTVHTSKAEQSVAGGPWTVVAENKATKVK
jgi:hypothetical protein